MSRHERRWVPVTIRSVSFLRDLANLREILRAEFHVNGTEVLFKILPAEKTSRVSLSLMTPNTASCTHLDPACPGNRDDVVTLGEQPGD